MSDDMKAALAAELEAALGALSRITQTVRLYFAALPQGVAIPEERTQNARLENLYRTAEWARADLADARDAVR